MFQRLVVAVFLIDEDAAVPPDIESSSFSFLYYYIPEPESGMYRYLHVVSASGQVGNLTCTPNEYRVWNFRVGAGVVNGKFLLLRLPFYPCKRHEQLADFVRFGRACNGVEARPDRPRDKQVEGDVNGQK